jgi:hypothetical protein
VNIHLHAVGRMQFYDDHDSDDDDDDDDIDDNDDV